MRQIFVSSDLRESDLAGKNFCKLPIALIRRCDVARRRFLDERADPINLGVPGQGAPDRCDDFVDPRQGHGSCLDPLPSGRLVAEQRYGIENIEEFLETRGL